MNLDKLVIGVTPITKRVRLGHVNAKGMWTKFRNITREFQCAMVEYCKGRVHTFAYDRDDGDLDVFTIKCERKVMSKEEFDKEQDGE